MIFLHDEWLDLVMPLMEFEDAGCNSERPGWEKEEWPITQSYDQCLVFEAFHLSFDVPAPIKIVLMKFTTSFITITIENVFCNIV